MPGSRRSMKAKQSYILAMAAAALIAACTDTSTTEAPEAPPSTASETASPSPTVTKTFPPKPMQPQGMEAPPPVTVRYFDQAIDLHAWTYCYETGCVDGAPRENLPHVGSPEDIVVEFPLPDWRFKASFTPSGAGCGRAQSVPLEKREDGTWLLQPAGYADHYDVTLMGRGEGDLVVTFEWETPHEGPLPKPKARLAVIAGDRRETISYGVDLTLTNLASTPKKARATITVTAANGESLTFEAKRSSQGCDREGSVYWNGPDDQGLAAAALGERPFKYRVELVLDGERYLGTATWPADEVRGYGPYTAVQFEPPLPALH